MRTSIALALDAVIALCGVALGLFLIGLVDLGVASVRQAEKPLFLLLLVVPLRIAIGGPSWFLHRFRPLVPHVARLRARTLDRVPPAVVDAAFALVVTRLAVLLVGFVANILFPPLRGRGFELPFHHVRFVEIFAAWDSGWYFDIARRGYYWHFGGQSSVAFFPLYPMTMRAVAWPFGSSDQALWLSGIAVSAVSFFLGLVALHRFTERVFGEREIARRAVLYIAIFPFSLFFTRVYAESLFFLTSVLAVSRAHQGQWWRAGLWGGLATLTRPNGILIGLPLALLALWPPGTRGGGFDPRLVARRLIALAPVPLAFAGYCAFVYSLSGDPLGWLAAQKHWDYSIGNPPWQLLLTMLGRLVEHGLYDYFFVTPLAPFRLFHGMAGLIFLALTPAIFKRLGVAMGAYVLASLVVPLSGSALEGVGRYAAVLFPAFMLVASFRSQRLHEAILITAALLLALFVCLFVTLRPIY